MQKNTVANEATPAAASAHVNYTLSLPASARKVEAITSPTTMPPQWVAYGGPYFAGFAAIVAATLATVVALRGIKVSRDNVVDQIVAQRQIAARTARASVVSANRQKWIDGLREDLAAFLAADFVLLDDASEDEDELSEAMQLEQMKLVRLAKRDRRLMQRRIQLRLNPDKPHHQELYRAVMAVIPATGSDHRRARTKLIRSAQKLLRQEWLRLKAEAGEWEVAADSTACLTPNETGT